MSLCETPVRTRSPTASVDTRVKACSQRTNSLSTNRPSFAAANQVVTLTRVTNERVVLLGRLAAGQFSSVHVQ